MNPLSLLDVPPAMLRAAARRQANVSPQGERIERGLALVVALVVAMLAIAAAVALSVGQP